VTSSWMLSLVPLWILPLARVDVCVLLRTIFVRVHLMLGWRAVAMTEIGRLFVIRVPANATPVTPAAASLLCGMCVVVKLQLRGFTSAVAVCAARMLCGIVVMFSHLCVYWQPARGPHSGSLCSCTACLVCTWGSHVTVSCASWVLYSNLFSCCVGMSTEAVFALCNP
jgi:hypothetical protein